MNINKKYHIKKINNYNCLEDFLEEANNMDLDIINVLKDGLHYIVIYKSYSEVSYEIR